MSKKTNKRGLKQNLPTEEKIERSRKKVFENDNIAEDIADVSLKSPSSQEETIESHFHAIESLPATMTTYESQTDETRLVPKTITLLCVKVLLTVAYLLLLLVITHIQYYLLAYSY